MGFGARFVTGYIQMREGQHGATHAWTEIYIPGAGWHGFDPTNNKLAGIEHISVAVARNQDKAWPLSGSWAGDASAFDPHGGIGASRARGRVAPDQIRSIESPNLGDLADVPSRHRCNCG